mgnify:CR=1 FL=1
MQKAVTYRPNLLLDNDGKRVGFADSAVISTSGTRVTVKDVN